MKRFLNKLLSFYASNPVMAYSITAGFLYGFYMYKERVFRLLGVSTWLNPVVGPVTSKFGLRIAPTGGASTNHQGVDIGVPLSTPIKCPKDGKIVEWAWSEDAGTYVTIDHGDYKTRYLHLSLVELQGADYSLTIDSFMNKPIKKGLVFAQSGTGGTGPHLHFELIDKKAGKAINPLRFFNFKN